MRQKKTRPQDQLEELPEISEKYMNFARLVAEGLSKTEAYRQAVSNKGQDSTIWANASRLASRDNVKAWINALKTEVFNTKKYDIISHILELEDLKQKCVESGNLGAAFQCTQAKGKALGMYIEKHEDVTPQADSTLENELQRLMGDNYQEGVKH